jgi:hypothetical protein
MKRFGSRRPTGEVRKPGPFGSNTGNEERNEKKSGP